MTQNTRKWEKNVYLPKETLKVSLLITALPSLSSTAADTLHKYSVLFSSSHESSSCVWLTLSSLVTIEHTEDEFTELKTVMVKSNVIEPLKPREIFGGDHVNDTSPSISETLRDDAIPNE